MTIEAEEQVEMVSPRLKKHEASLPHIQSIRHILIANNGKSNREKSRGDEGREREREKGY